MFMSKRNTLINIINSFLVKKKCALLTVVVGFIASQFYWKREISTEIFCTS